MSEELVIRAETAAANAQLAANQAAAAAQSTATDREAVEALVSTIETEQLPSIQASKEAIRAAIVEQGQECDTTVPFEQYADKIKAIDTSDFSEATIGVKSYDIRANIKVYDGAGDVITGDLSAVTLVRDSNTVSISRGIVDADESIVVGTKYTGSTTITPSTDPYKIPADTYLDTELTIEAVSEDAEAEVEYGYLTADGKIQKVNTSVTPAVPVGDPVDMDLYLFKLPEGVEAPSWESPDFSFVTATADKIIQGYVGADASGNPVEGTIPIVTANQIYNTVHVPAGFHENDNTYTVDVPDLTGVNVTADKLLEGTIAVDGAGSKVVGTIETVTASVDGNKITIPVGYIAEAQTFDSLNTSDATATANKILYGATAYVNGEKITGSIPTVMLQTSENVVTMPKGYSDGETVTIPEMSVEVTEDKIIVPVGYNKMQREFELTSGGGSSTEFGYINANGNFQPVDLSGDTPADSGEARSVDLKMFNTGVPLPDVPSQPEEPETHWLVDEHTVYAASGSDGMTELVSGESLTNSGGTVIADGAFDFAASESVLDFPISDDAKWHMGDFTMEVVCTPCQPSFSYPSVIATGDNWENNAMMLRFGNQGNRSIGYFWTNVGDPVTQGGDIEYSNTDFRHMAICRFGNSVTIYDNGTAVATATVDRVWNAASDNIIRLGALDKSTAKYVGKIRWSRISNIARYTSDFDATPLLEK